MIKKILSKIGFEPKENKTSIVKTSKSKCTVSSNGSSLFHRYKRASFITPEFETVLKKTPGLRRALLDVILSSRVIKSNRFEILSLNKFKKFPGHSLNTDNAYVIKINNGNESKKYYLKTYNITAPFTKSLDALQVWQNYKNGFVEAYLLSELEKLGYPVVKPKFAKVKFTSKYNYNFIISEFKDLMPISIAVKKKLISKKLLAKIEVDVNNLKRNVPKKMKLSVEDLNFKNIFVDINNGTYKLFVLDVYSNDSFKLILNHLLSQQ